MFVYFFNSFMALFITPLIYSSFPYVYWEVKSLLQNMIYKLKIWKKKKLCLQLNGLKDSESRKKEIVNSRAYSDKSKLLDLTLFGGRKVESYVEDEKATAERIANARIYGIDQGSIKDVEPFKTIDEIDLYFNIDAMGGHIWYCRHEMSHGRIPKVDLTEEQYVLEYMVLPFGIL